MVARVDVGAGERSEAVVVANRIQFSRIPSVAFDQESNAGYDMYDTRRALVSARVSSVSSSHAVMIGKQIRSVEDRGRCVRTRHVSTRWSASRTRRS